MTSAQYSVFGCDFDWFFLGRYIPSDSCNVGGHHCFTKETKEESLQIIDLTFILVSKKKKKKKKKERERFSQPHCFSAGHLPLVTSERQQQPTVLKHRHFSQFCMQQDGTLVDKTQKQRCRLVPS